MVLPRWGLVGGVAFLAAGLIGSFGAVTGWLWGRLVAGLAAGGDPWPEAAGLVGCLLLAPVLVALALRTYPMWWTAVSLRPGRWTPTGWCSTSTAGWTPSAGWSS